MLASLKVGIRRDYYFHFVVSDPDTGQAQDADALPVANIYSQNSQNPLGFSPTVENIATQPGLYVVTVPADGAGIAAGFSYNVKVTATVNPSGGGQITATYSTGFYAIEFDNDDIMAKLNEGGGGNGLTKQDVRDAMTLDTAEIPEPGSIDEKIDKTPGNTWTIPGRTVEGGTINTCVSNTDMRGTDGASTHSAADVWDHSDRRLTQNATGEYAEGAVWVNDTVGAAGTTPGINGTQQNPVGTIEDALAICNATGLEKVHITGVIPLQGDVTLGPRTFYSEDYSHGYIVLAGFTCNANDTVFRRLGVSQAGGTWTSNAGTVYDDCSVPTSMLPNGRFYRCFMNGTVLRPATNSEMHDCYGTGNRLAIELPTNFHVRGYRGMLRFQQGTATSHYRFLDVEGDVDIDSSVNLTTGSITVTGKGIITDNATNANLDRTGFYNENHISGTTPEEIWTHPTREVTGGHVDSCASNADMRGTDGASTHTAADVWASPTREVTNMRGTDGALLSSDPRLDNLDEQVSTRASQASLDAQNDVSIGEVQAGCAAALSFYRLDELLFSDLDTLPDNESLWGKLLVRPSYDVDEGIQFSDSALELATATTSGQAQGGDLDTIVLANTEPGTEDHIFQGSTIAIQSGKGEKQVRTCTAYVAATRTATVSPAWNVAPDATSHYTIYPGPTAGAQGGGNDVNVVAIAGQAISNQAGQNVNYHYDNAGQPTTKTVEDTGVPGTGLTPQMVRDAMQLSPTTPGANAPDSIDERVSEEKRRDDVWLCPDGTPYGDTPNTMGFWQAQNPIIDPQDPKAVWLVDPDDPDLAALNTMAELQRRANLGKIDGDDLNGNNATLRLKQLDIKNSGLDNPAVKLETDLGNTVDVTATGANANAVNAEALGDNGAALVFRAHGTGGFGGVFWGDGLLGGGIYALGNNATQGYGLRVEGTTKDIDAGEIDAIKAKTDQMLFDVASNILAQMTDASIDALRKWLDVDTLRTQAAAGSVAELSKATQVETDPPPSAEEIADQVWRENLGDHTAVLGSTAEALDKGSNSVPEIADGVWRERLSDHSGVADSAAEALQAAADHTPEANARAVWDEDMTTPGPVPNSTKQALENAGGVGAVNITIAPLDVTIADPITVSKDFRIARNAAEPEVIFTFYNADGSTMDLSNFDKIKLNAYAHGKDNTPVWFRSTDSGEGIRVEGADNNQLAIKWNPADINDTKVWAYTLYVVDTEMVLARGSITVYETAIDEAGAQP